MARARSLDVPQRIQRAMDAGEALRSGNSIAAVATLKRLSHDEEWKVRQAVAQQLEDLPDADFTELSALLVADDNYYVSRSARNAIERRERGSRESSRRMSGSVRVAEGYERFAKKYGAQAAADAKNLGERWCEEAIETIAHESLNSLTSVQLSLARIKSQFAERFKAREEALAEITFAGTSVTFLQRLMGDMRDYFCDLTTERTQEYLCNVVEEALARSRTELAALGLNHSHVEVDMQVPKNLAVSVSHSIFVASLKNLIKNAIEAILDAPGDGCVRISAKVQEGAVLIEIRDNGCGIVEETLVALRRFLPGKTTRTSRGTGFGLPLVNRYVLQHSGELRIESQPNQGTVVTIILPQEEGE